MQKIAVPVNHNQDIDGHFGQCAFYQIYTVDTAQNISKVETLKSSQGCGCKSDIAQVLSDQGVGLMLVGGIGQGAIQVLNQWGIEVLRGCSGNAENLVRLYLEGKLTDSGESCHHHEHHHAHNQGSSCKH